MTGATSTRGSEARATLRAAWQAERDAACSARRTGDLAGEWRHLGRAHILSQPFAGLHLRTHLSMLATAGRERNGREVLGQLMRVLVAAPGSLSGRYPVGNTGGADVSAFRPMEVPDDLRPFLVAVGGAA